MAQFFPAFYTVGVMTLVYKTAKTWEEFWEQSHGIQLGRFRSYTR